MQKIHFILFILFFIWITGFNPILSQEKYSIDTNESSIKWTGEKFAGIHYGKINIIEGVLLLMNRKITGGHFVVDMTSIEIDDLEKDKWYDKFLKHLNSESFFDTEKHTKSYLSINKTKVLTDSTSKIFATLEIKEIKNNIEFIASYSFKNDAIHAKTKLIIDRKKYNIGYGDENIFDKIGDGFLYDEFSLEINIISKQR